MSPPPVPASAVILTRRPRRSASNDAGAEEVFLVERAEAQPFLGGFACFPGGRGDPDDAGIAVAGATGEAAATVATAARELFEETGVLVGRGAEAVDAVDLAAARAQILARQRSFGEALESLAVQLDARDFAPAGRWVTPAYVPLRFDTQYFLVAAPAGQAATVIPGELDAGRWLTVAAAEAAMARGELLLPPPVRYALQALGVGDDAALARLREAPARHAAAEAARIFEVVPGIVLVALASPTLPPARFTNCYVVGTGAAVIVDPGSPYPADQDVLDEALALLAARGTVPREVILTHEHPDHVGGAAHLRARHGLPVAAHPAAAERLRGVVPVDRLLADDEVIALPGTPARRLRVVATPGHAPGHVALLDETAGALLTGDLVATQGFIIVDPDDGGDMAVYLDSLRRARDLGARLLLPAHGYPSRHAAARFDEYLAHRLAREALVLDALAAARTPVTAEALLPIVYSDTPKAMWPFAARSLLAHLNKLAAEGRVGHAAGGWRVAPAG
jgi:glyoxylase-like metal-dependent hydrolase (beta-lactamase superfamily II)/8-oxo-dGTP pyrophosphatase MutT (NUDIX family)